MKNVLLILAIGCGDKEDLVLEETETTEEATQTQEIEEPAPEFKEETTEESSSYYTPQETDVIKTINTISSETETTDSTSETETVEVFETKQ